MKHNVGDVVRIKSKEWYEKNMNECRDIEPIGGTIGFVKDMSKYCGMKATITHLIPSYYKIDIDDSYWDWTDDMFEEEAVVQQINNSTSKPIDWEQRFYEISKDILQGICAHVGNNFVSSDVKLSLIYADELIKQLKEREGIK